MDHGYNSLRESIQREIGSQKSVLNKFPESIGRPITQSCSRYLAQFTSYQLPFKADVTTVTTIGNIGASAATTVKSNFSQVTQAGENVAGANDLNSSNPSQGHKNVYLFDYVSV